MHDHAPTHALDDKTDALVSKIIGSDAFVESFVRNKEGRGAILNHDIRDKLTNFGLIIFDNVYISRELLYRGPCFVKDNSLLQKAKIDSYSYVGNNCLLVTSSVGRYTSIANYVSMGLGQHSMSAATTSVAFYQNNYFNDHAGPISHIPQYKIDRQGEETDIIDIGHDVWIGDRVIFTGDINVGHGAVIGAGTIVTKDVPPFAVVLNRNGYGQVIKSRFSDEICSDLMEIQWWNYDLPRINSAVEVLIRLLKGLPLYGITTNHAHTAIKLNPQERAQFDELTIQRAKDTIHSTFGLNEISLKDLASLYIPYENPQEFVQYFKDHKDANFEPITARNFYRVIVRSSSEVMLSPEDPDIKLFR